MPFVDDQPTSREIGSHFGPYLSPGIGGWRLCPGKISRNPGTKASHIVATSDRMLRVISNSAGHGVIQRLTTLAGSTVFCLMAVLSTSDAQAHSRGHHRHHRHH